MNKRRRHTCLNLYSTQNTLPRGEKDRKSSRVEGFVHLNIQDKGSQYNDVQILHKTEKPSLSGLHRPRTRCALGENAALPPGLPVDFKAFNSKMLFWQTFVHFPSLAMSLSVYFGKHTHAWKISKNNVHWLGDICLDRARLILVPLCGDPPVIVFLRVVAWLFPASAGSCWGLPPTGTTPCSGWVLFQSFYHFCV